MRTKQSTLALLFSVALIAGCAGSTELSGAKLEAHVQERLKMFEQAFNGTSVDAIMEFFSEEPEVLPGGQSVKGTQNVRGVMQQSIAGTSDLILNVRDVIEGDGTFEQRGQYLLDDGSQYGQNGSFKAIWTRDESGVWLISQLGWTDE